MGSTDKKGIINQIILSKKREQHKIERQQRYLNQLIEKNFDAQVMEILGEDILVLEKQNGDFIRNELKRAFPEGLGLWLVYHFSPYLDEPVDTTEKYEAWLRIVKFLDDLEDIEVPRLISKTYQDFSEDEIKRMHEGQKKEMIRVLSLEGKALEDFKVELVKQIDRFNEEREQVFMKYFNRLKREMNKFFNASGYYDIFIPCMKILSKEYREYHDTLTNFNEKMCKELGIKYGEPYHK